MRIPEADVAVSLVESRRTPYTVVIGGQLPILEGFGVLPPHGIAGLVMLLLYAIESELRFGAKARSFWTGNSDRKSTWAVSLASAVPVLGFVFAMKTTSSWVPDFLRTPSLPGMPGAAWLGVTVAGIGLILRAWACTSRAVYPHPDDLRGTFSRTWRPISLDPASRLPRFPPVRRSGPPAHRRVRLPA